MSGMYPRQWADRQKQVRDNTSGMVSEMLRWQCAGTSSLQKNQRIIARSVPCCCIPNVFQRLIIFKHKRVSFENDGTLLSATTRPVCHLDSRLRFYSLVEQPTNLTGLAYASRRPVRERRLPFSIFSPNLEFGQLLHSSGRCSFIF